MLESSINTLLSYESSKIFAVVMLIATGFFFRFTMQLFGQAWITTKAHTATLLLLPIITFVITNVISGNIALSLGMVGALSIVRFRNPVRSPLELSTYFGAITMGITAAVSLKWLVFLVCSILLAVLSMLLANFLSIKIFKRPMFIASFSEGNTLSVLTVQLSNTLDILESNGMLQAKVASKESVTYSLASSDFSKLTQLEKNEEIREKAISIELRR